MSSQQPKSLPLRVSVITLIIIIIFGLLWSVSQGLLVSGDAQAPVYEGRIVHNPYGIGKFYIGREIAQVMGHTGADWLERSSRVTEEQPQQVVNALDLKPTDIVADIGAGTGYMSFRISPFVPEGKVLAVDVQPEMLDVIDSIKREKKITNVEPVLGTARDPHLPPGSIDLALMVDAYHEFSYPKEMMEAMVGALKPTGRVVLVEYRGEDPFVFINPVHKMTQQQVRQEMQAVGLVWRQTKSVLPQQHLMVFEKAMFGQQNAMVSKELPEEPLAEHPSPLSSYSPAPNR